MWRVRTCAGVCGVCVCVLWRRSVCGSPGVRCYHVHGILRSHHCGLITCQGRQRKMSGGLRSDVRAAPGGDATLIPEQPRQGSRRPAPGSRATPEPDQVDTSRTLPVKAGSVPAGTRQRAGAAPPHHGGRARTHARAYTRPPLVAPARSRASRLPLPLLNRNRFPGWFSPQLASSSSPTRPQALQ